MSTATRERLYELLPAIYRIRDAENGEPLHALLTIMGDELARIEDDIAGLYDDWFIETCAEWVVPYICLLYTSPSPRDRTRSRMPSSA